MTEKKVIEILATQLRLDRSNITPETNIASDLGADSLDLVEILVSIEDEFGVPIPDEAVPGIVTVADLVNYIDSNKK